MAETGKTAKASRRSTKARKKDTPFSIRLPAAWLLIADSVARSSEFGATRTSVIRAAVQKGLSALAGRPVG